MDRFAKETAYLVALDASLSSREFPLEHSRLLIGRDGSRCDIVAAGGTISRLHAGIEWQAEQTYTIKDFDSTNGVYINGRRIEQEALLQEGDLIGLGSPETFHLRFQQSSSRHAGWMTTLPLAEEWTIGRESNCDISLPFEAVVSSYHAVLKNVRGKLVLVDKDSLNGTWVNGGRVKKLAIQPADTVVIGPSYFHFTLHEDGSLEVNRKDCGDDIQLECVDLSFGVKKSNNTTHLILDGITLSLEPGEFVGILGPSGAGKSTLLKALNGYLPPSAGTVLLNETPLYETYQMFRSSIGYVPQDDILHNELSVEKSLEYVARLRLPSDLGDVERSNIVESTIETLGLSHVRGQSIMELSGGQRKRVSIGAELLTKPSILFLDEPTAGLDPSVEERIMHHFKKMTHNGTTILITTHILYSLDMLDRVIILSQGKLVFFGKPHEALDFFAADGHEVTRPTQIFDILEQVSQTGQTAGDQRKLESRKDTAERFATRYIDSEYQHKHVTLNQTVTAKQLEKTKKKHQGPAKSGRKVPGKSIFGAFFPWRDALILTSRQMRLRIGSGKRALLYALIPVLLALVTMSQQVPGLEDDTTYLANREQYAGQLQGIPPQIESKLKSLLSVEGEEETRSLPEVIFSLKHQGVQNLPLPMSAMLMCIMTAVFLGTINTCLEISTEKSIYQRERMSSLRIVDYICSKLPLVFVVTMVQIALFLGLLCIHPDYRTLPLLQAWPVLIIVAWSSAVLGILISTLDPTRGQLSVIFAIAAVLPQLILSGGLGPDYYQGLSPTAHHIANLLPAKWGLEMLFTAVYQHLDFASTGWVEQFVKENVGFAFGGRVLLKGTAVLVAQSFVWLLLCAWILKRKDSIKL